MHSKNIPLDQSAGSVCVECLFLRTPNRAPYRTPPACAKRATYSDPPPVVPHPESIDAQAAYPYRHSAIAQVGCVLTVAASGTNKQLSHGLFVGRIEAS